MIDYIYLRNDEYIYSSNDRIYIYSSNDGYIIHVMIEYIYSTNDRLYFLI